MSADDGPEERPEEVQAGREEPAASDEGPGPAGEQPDSASAQSAEEQDKHIFQQVFNIYHGEVQTGDAATASFAVGGNVHRETGQVADAELAVLGARYFRPPAFGDALRRLEREHLLMLVGPEGSGRAAAALMLAAELREHAGVERKISRMPPTRTLELLCQQKYGERCAYLIKDWMQGAVGRGTQAQYDADDLAQRLRDAKAYLVITAKRRSKSDQGTARYEMEWPQPDPASVFDHFVADLGQDAEEFAEDLPRLRERAEQAVLPRRVAQLFSRLRLKGVAAALADDDARDQREVRDWFDQKPNPSRRALRAVAVLTLACRAGDETGRQPGVTQRGFEGLYVALEKAEARYRGDAPPERDAPPEDEEFPQFRHSLFEQVGLSDFTVAPPSVPEVGYEHAPGFTTARLRELFQKELHRRYGDELWSSLRICFDGLLDTTDITDVHLAVACGVGRMARFESRRVREEYLQRWAAGTLVARHCAVFALWAMAAEDDLAPVALEQVGGWTSGRGEQRAITAAITLGGILGIRYQSEALWHLWILARRGERISGFARVAIAHLMWTEAECNEANVVRVLAGKVRPLFDPRTRAETRRSVLFVVIGILEVPGDDMSVPGVVDVLRSSSAAFRPLGELWAAVLYSTPHRMRGLAILHRVFAVLAEAPQGTEIVARLGAEILPRLPATHRRQVELGLLNHYYDAEERRRAQAVLAAFLSAAPGHGVDRRPA